MKSTAWTRQLGRTSDSLHALLRLSIVGTTEHKAIKQMADTIDRVISAMQNDNSSD